MTNEISIELPWPPSANRYWRKFRNRIVVSPEAKAYKATVKKLSLFWPRVFFPTQELVLYIQACPPNKRHFDLDNRLKIAIDSLQGILFTDDSQIKDIHIVSCPVYSGKLLVRLSERIKETK